MAKEIFEFKRTLAEEVCLPSAIYIHQVVQWLYYGASRHTCVSIDNKICVNFNNYSAQKHFSFFNPETVDHILDKCVELGLLCIFVIEKKQYICLSDRTQEIYYPVLKERLLELTEDFENMRILTSISDKSREEEEKSLGDNVIKFKKKVNT